MPPQKRRKELFYDFVEPMRFTLQSLENDASYFEFPWFYSNKAWETSLRFYFLLGIFQYDMYVSSDQVVDWHLLAVYYSFICNSLWSFQKIILWDQCYNWFCVNLSGKNSLLGHLILNQRVWNQKEVQFNLRFWFLTIFI